MIWAILHPWQILQALIHGVAEQRHLAVEQRAAGIRDQLADDIHTGHQDHDTD